MFKAKPPEIARPVKAGSLCARCAEFACFVASGPFACPMGTFYPAVKSILNHLSPLAKYGLGEKTKL
jgi:hypothetical protein